MDYQTQRTNLIEWTKNQLIGFDYKDNILVGIAPLDRFFTGILFPVFQSEDGLDVDETEDEIENDDKETAQPVKKEKRYIPPSSAGFSFYLNFRSCRQKLIFKC